MDQEIISIADKVIELLKQRKIMEMPDLVKETGANESDIKLIIGLLEKEEMVEVEYNLTKVLISWNDEADRLLMKIKKNQKISAWDPSKHTSKTDKRKQHTGFLVPLKLQREEEYLGEKRQEFEAKEALNISDDAESSKFGILDGNIDSRKIEKQIRDIELRISSKERLQDQKKQVSFSHSKQEEKQKAQKPGSSRSSTFNIGAFAVKQPESDGSDSDEEIPTKGRNVSKENNETFEIFNSKTENILAKPKQSAFSKPMAKSQSKTKKEKEIDKEVKEIERTILFRLGEPLKQNGESYDIIDLKESDIVSKVKKDLERKPRGSQAGKTVLNSYKADADEGPSQKPYVPEQNVRVQSDGDMLGKLKEKLTEIVNKKSEILELNKEKTILFDDSHLALKSKLITEISALGKLVENRETRIKELQSKISELPNSLKRLESDIRGLRQVQAELNEQFNSSTDEVRILKSQVKETRDDSLKELMLLKEHLLVQENELKKMNQVYKSFKSNEEQLANSISYVRDRIRGSQAELLNLEKELEDIIFNSDSIRQKIEEITKSLRQTTNQFEKSVNKLKRLDELNFSISAIEDSYNSLKSEIGSKLDKYEKEMLAMKESIQFDFTRKYLQELERLTLQNESEFKSLLINEERIDSEIEMKKKELSSLIEQAKSLQAVVSGSDPTKLDFGPDYAKGSSLFYSINSADKGEAALDFEKITLDSSEISQKGEKQSFSGKLDQFFTDLAKKIK